MGDEVDENGRDRVLVLVLQLGQCFTHGLFAETGLPEVGEPGVERCLVLGPRDYRGAVGRQHVP
jgi:hypothetical protein